VLPNTEKECNGLEGNGVTGIVPHGGLNNFRLGLGAEPSSREI